MSSICCCFLISGKACFSSHYNVPGWISAGHWISPPSSLLHTNPRAISNENSDLKHTARVPVESNHRVWTLFHWFTLSVSVSASFPHFSFRCDFALPNNSCQSHSVVFHADQDEAKLKHRLMKTEDVGKDGGDCRLWNMQGQKFLKGAMCKFWH